MNTKSKKTNPKKRDPNDFTLIELRKTTVGKLKAMQSNLYTAQGKFVSYDKIINSLLN